MDDLIQEYVDLLFDDKAKVRALLNEKLTLLKAITDKKTALGIPLNRNEIESMRIKVPDDTLDARVEKIFQEEIATFEGKNVTKPVPSKLKTVDEMITEYTDKTDFYAANGMTRPEEFNFEELSLDLILEKAMKSKKAKRSHHATASPVQSQSSGCSFRLDKEFIKSVPGLFSLLRLFLVNYEASRIKSQRTDPLDDMGSKSPYLTTAQLCERVREWQLNDRVRKLNAQWINKTPDWSLLVENALLYLTAESRFHMDQRDTPDEARPVYPPCPRPFVEYRPRLTQWLWITAAVTLENRSNPENEDYIMDEKKKLTRLFPEWAKVAIKHLKMPKAKIRVSAAPQKAAKAPKSAAKSATPFSSTGEPAAPSEPIVYVPPALYPTTWKVRRLTPEENIRFRRQEMDRFSRPWQPFVYNVTGYSSVVRPLRPFVAKGQADGSRGADGMQRSSEGGRARHHPLLRHDRPPVVGMADIVRDAVARLPNGEGSRKDIFTLVVESGFLISDVDQKHLNQSISGALDRLQCETDSAVLFQNDTRKWIYRHRSRTKDDFIRMFDQQCEMEDQKRRLKRVHRGEEEAYGYGARPAPARGGGSLAVRRGQPHVPGRRGRRPTRGLGPANVGRRGGGGGGRPPLSHPTYFEEPDRNASDQDDVPDIDDLLRMDELEASGDYLNPEYEQLYQRGYQMYGRGGGGMLMDEGSDESSMDESQEEPRGQIWPRPNGPRF